MSADESAKGQRPGSSNLTSPEVVYVSVAGRSLLPWRGKARHSHHTLPLGLRTLPSTSKAQPEQEARPHSGTDINKTQVAPVHRIPLPEAVIDLQPHGRDASQMAEIRQQQAKEEDAPDFDVGRGAQHEGFVEGEDEVEVGELVEDDGFAGGEGGGEGRGEGEVHVGALVEGGVVGAYRCCDGLDVEEEEPIEQGDGGGPGGGAG